MAETAESHNVPRGAAYFTSQQFISYVASFLFYITLARLLTKDEIGQVSILAATLAIFTTLTQLALPATVTRYISSSIGRGQRDTATGVVRASQRITIAVASAGAIVALVISPLIGSRLFDARDATTLLVTVFLTGLFLDFTALYGGYFLGTGLYAQTVYQNILFIPFSRGLGLLLAAVGLGVEGIILGWAIGGFTTLLVSVYMWHNRLSGKNSHPIRPLLAFALPLFASTLISLGQQWGDIVILQAILGQLSTTGAYYIIVSSVSFLSILWIPVSSALYPALSADHSTNRQRNITNRLSLAVRLTNLGVVPLSASLAVVSATALEIAYEQSYSQEALPFAILTITSIFTAQAAILTATLQAVGKTRSLLQVTLAATIIDLATVILTARFLGPTAGALGRTFLYATTVAASYSILRKTIQTSPFTGFRKATALALGVSVPLLAADQFLINVLILPALLRLPVLLAIFTAAFLSVSRTMHVFRPGDFAILKDALPRRLHPHLRAIERLIMGPHELPSHVASVS